MQSRIIFLFTILLSSFAWAQLESYELNFYLLNMQKRLVYNTNQDKQYTNFSVYGLDFRIEKFVIGFENSQNSSSSVDGNISIKQKYNESNLILGYQVFDYEIEDGLMFRVIGEGQYGVVQSITDTTLAASTSSQESENYSEYGAGIALELKYICFILAFDQKWVHAEVYSPSTLYLYQVKSGLSFSF